MFSQLSVNVHVEWVDRAIKSGGKSNRENGRTSLLVLLYLVQCRKLQGSNPFRLDYSIIGLFGFRDSRTVKKYLPKLEGWGLIEVEYFDHAAPKVKLLGDTRRPPEVVLKGENHARHS